MLPPGFLRRFPFVVYPLQVLRLAWPFERIMPAERRAGGGGGPASKQPGAKGAPHQQRGAGGGGRAGAPPPRQEEGEIRDMTDMVLEPKPHPHHSPRTLSTQHSPLTLTAHHSPLNLHHHPTPNQVLEFLTHAGFDETVTALKKQAG